MSSRNRGIVPLCFAAIGPFSYGVIQNWVAGATQPNANSFGNMFISQLTSENLLKSLCLSAVFVGFGFWMRKKGKSIGSSEGYQKALNDFTDQAANERRDANRWIHFLRPIQVITEKRNALIDILQRMRNWTEGGIINVASSPYASICLTRVWNKIIHPQLELLCNGESYIAEPNFRRLIGDINEFDCMVHDFFKYHIIYPRNFVEIPADGSDLDVDIRKLQESWNSTYQSIKESIIAWNSLNPNAEPLMVGYTANERY